MTGIFPGQLGKSANVTAIADLSLLALAFVADAILESAPLIMLMAGALALSIGVIAWPPGSPAPKPGGENGFI